MKTNMFCDCIDEYSATPKYLQLSRLVIKAIEQGKLKMDSMLPSINEVSCNLELSRDTAEKGYRYLKKKGIINSVPGKGYYITNTNFKQQLKVFLLFNKLSAHKKIIYDAFIATLGQDVTVDFYIYNNNFSLFKHFLANQKDDYSHYVIIPHFIDDDGFARDVINLLPKHKLVMLDKLLPGIEGEYAAAYENFEQNIYNALEQALAPLSKYHTIKIIFPKQSYFPKEILKGFIRFCQQYAFTHQVVNNISIEPINSGEVFINLMEDDLVVLLERLISLGSTIGKDVGVISYNETPLKKILVNGISTISTDFSFMGNAAANLILDNSRRHIEVPFYFTKRASL
ncbi:transcriptional regulator, GntR family [Pedobacter westerhofensis]|uniref:Transcriptional regulator, GntR family n=1 Tax=Pedobacter westerhofensis TaxID=425512 RepID=A0A521EHQ1_9SPHI|nr:substrate-binding domain-containing protein [Pedobacter westerhofensis]SMO83454.1 transcriptional regulator, GntR family [Pedobacter westerhofensis]